jgi:hypothetical protein
MEFVIARFVIYPESDQQKTTQSDTQTQQVYSGKGFVFE